MSRRRTIHFDLMRAIAILSVLIYHLPGYSFNFFDLNWAGIEIDPSVLRESTKYFGLGLFVFISGYLSNLKERNFSDTEAVKRYVSRKLIKLLPLYYLALIAFFYIYDVNEPLRVAIHVLGLQLLFASEQIKPSVTLWFVGLLLIYYAIYMFVRAERVSDVSKLAVLVLFPVVVYLMNQFFDIMDLRIVLYYGIFLLGLYSARFDLLNRMSWIQMIVAVFLFTGFLVVRGNYEFATRPFSSLISFGIVNALMFFFICFTHKVCLLLANKKKIGRLTEVVSYSSFGMFLFHRPVWSLMHKALIQIPVMKSQDLMAVAMAFVGIPAIIAITYWLQRLYDSVIYEL